MNPTNMQCPDCGSCRRGDGYHREGWYWLECGRRYNPDLDKYSPPNFYCKNIQLEAKGFEELHNACLEYLKHPPSNVPARRKFAEIVTGGSCDHLDDDVVTEQHECEWMFCYPENLFECCVDGCDKTLDIVDVNIRLNKYGTLNRQWAIHYRSLAEDVALAYDVKREQWREYVPEKIAEEIDALCQRKRK